MPTTKPVSRIATRLFPWLTRVDAGSLRADALAGLLGALLVLPQGIAFAALAGLPPQYGLYTAIVPCVVAAMAGSSWHVVSGPTNANSLALLAMLAPLALPGSAGYIELALAVTLMVGLLQLAIGGLRLGWLAHFISPAALRGFMGGAALLIAVHALKDLLGLAAMPIGQGAGAVLGYVAGHAAELQPAALGVGAIALAAVLALRRVAPRWPAMLIALAAATMAAWWLRRAGMEVHTVGLLPSPWPALHLPQVPLQRVPELMGLAFALTIVALGQSISIAKAVAARSGQLIDADREFIGQGLSNMVGGLFSCYVSCGSLNRSMPNLEAGARTPLAAVFSAVLLLALVALSAPLLALIPMAAIGALLLWVAWSLLDLPSWRELARLSRTDFVIALATLAATLTLRLEVAILLGTLASLVTYLSRTARPAMRSMGFDSFAADRPFVVVDGNPKAMPECPQLKLLRMEGSVFFGAVPHVADRLFALRSEPQPQHHLLVMSKSMNFIDLPGAQLWQRELQARRAMGGDLYFHRPRPQVLETWQRIGFFDELGEDHVFADKRSALAAIVPRLDGEICAKCSVRCFEECERQPGAKDWDWQV